MDAEKVETQFINFDMHVQLLKRRLSQLHFRFKFESGFNHTLYKIELKKIITELIKVYKQID